MTREFQRIEVNPKKLNGQPCIKGTRITVYDILDYLSSGMSIADIVKDYPPLTEADVKEAIDFVKEWHKQTKYLSASGATT